MTLQSTINVQVQFDYRKTFTSTGFNSITPSATPTLSYTKTMATGTAINQMDLLYYAQRTVSSSSNDDVDLAGVLSDIWGDTVTLVKCKMLWFHNLSTTVGDNLTVGAAASNQFLLFSDASDSKVVGPDGLFLVIEPSLAGITVTAGTGDILRVANGTGGDITYELGLGGTSA